MKSPKEFGEYLDVLIEKAPELRASGVLGFKGGDVFGEVMLNPNAGSLLQETPVAQVEGNNATDEADPLEDPLAYGLPPGTTMPWQEGDLQ